MLETLFSAKVITIAVLLGVLLLFVGSLIAVNAAYTEPVDITEPDDINDAREQAYNQYKIGVTVMVLGNMFIVMFLLCGSVMSQNVPTNVKVGFLIFCAILVLVTSIMVLGYTSTMLQTGPSIFE